MSVVTVQVGQCGNQLGASLFQALHEHAVHSTDDNSTTTSASAVITKTAPGGTTDGATTDGAAASAAAATACRRGFFRDGGIARAVIVDTEPKVIESIAVQGGGGGGGHGGDRRVEHADQGETHAQRRRPRRPRDHGSSNNNGDSSGVGGGRGAWTYDWGTQVCCHAQGGAANNWAYGYHAHGAAFAEACLESVRRETERCDRLAGLCVLHSAAGGTGSGLGTYLTEALRDDLPSAFLLNTVVCAHGSGEVILQNYNTLLTLSKLAKCSDGILVVENETATAVCRKLLRLERPSHADLNKVISSSLAGALVPTAATSGARAGGGGGAMLMHLGDKLAHLCPNKDFVFLRASMVPQIPDRSRAFTSNTWEALARRAYQMHITGAPAELDLDWRKKVYVGAGAGVGLNQSVSSLLTFYGASPGGAVPPPADCFRNRALYAEWSPTPFMECESPLRLHGHDRALSLLSNSQAVLGVLDTAVERSLDMYHAGAYVHQYAKFGMERGDFEEAFMGMEQAVENYRSLG